MTPAARWAAAARIMDEITAGAPAEKALTNWARRSRFAGSKDRAAVRDHVYDILRNWRSVAALGGGTSGRALVLGRLRQADMQPDAVFTGEGYALEPLTQDERTSGSKPQGAAAADVPDWLFERLVNELSDDAHVIFDALKTRARVFLRVNTLKTTVEHARSVLSDAGIATRPHPLSSTALDVTEGARQVAQSAAYVSGLVELQDAASQAVVDALPLGNCRRVLDYCAGGGGKTLAMAAHLNGPVEAHDADPRRMSDLPERAARAGAKVAITRTPAAPYDLILCDVPCSGSGAWRRSPDGKWRLTPERLAELQKTQFDILETCSDLVAPHGILAYATCSILRSENEDQIEAFLKRHPGWQNVLKRRFSPIDGGDGFFVATLTRKTD